MCDQQNSDSPMTVVVLESVDEVLGAEVDVVDAVNVVNLAAAEAFPVAEEVEAEARDTFGGIAEEVEVDVVDTLDGVVVRLAAGKAAIPMTEATDVRVKDDVTVELDAFVGAVVEESAELLLEDTATVVV